MIDPKEILFIINVNFKISNAEDLIKIIKSIVKFYRIRDFRSFMFILDEEFYELESGFSIQGVSVDFYSKKDVLTIKSAISSSIYDRLLFYNLSHELFLVDFETDALINDSVFLFYKSNYARNIDLHHVEIQEHHVNTGMISISKKRMMSGKTLHTFLRLDNSSHRTLSHYKNFVSFGKCFDVHQDSLEDLSSWANQDLRPCLFLDRDGVIIEDTSYPHKSSDLKILPGIIPILEWALIRKWYIIVVTNQAGIAKEKFSLDSYFQFEEEIEKKLMLFGVKLDQTYFCPFHQSGTSTAYKRVSFDRKPNPGLVLRALSDYPIDLSKSIMIGDKSSDKLEHLCLHTILIRGKYPIKESTEYQIASDHFEAFDMIKERVLALEGNRSCKNKVTGSSQ